MATGLLDPRVDVMIDMVQPVNLLHPLNRGLVSWWLASPGTMGGSRFVDVMSPGPNGNHGTLTNMNPATDWVGSSRPGGWGALDFGGTDEHIAIGSKDYIASGRPFCISFWMNPDDSALEGIFQVQSSNTTSGFTALIFDSGADYHSINMGGRNAEGWGETYHPIADITADLIDSWNFIVINYNGGTTTSVDSFKLFINGINEPLEIGANFAAHGNNNVIAREGTGSDYFNGTLDDFRIYGSRELTVSEIFQLYQLSQQGYPGLLNRIDRRVFAEVAVGRIMGSLAGHGGLAGPGGIAGRRGGIAA